MTLAWIALVIASAVLAYRKRSWGGVVIMALLPAYLLRTRIADLPTTMLEAAVIGSCAGFYAKIAFERRIISAWRENKRNHLLAPALFLLASAAMAVLVPKDWVSALGVWRAYFLEPIAALPLLFTALGDRKTRESAFAILALEATALAGVALLQAAGAIPSAGAWAAERRATGIYPYPNAVGLFLGPLIPFFAAIAALGKTTDRRLRWLFAAASIACLAGSVASETEAAVGAAAIALATLGIAYGRSVRKATVALVAIGIVAAIAIAPIRSGLTEKLTFQDWSGTVRRVMWRETATMLMTTPVFGAGLSGYRAAVAPFHADPKVEIFQYPHQVFLNVWSELGLIGAIAVAWVLAVFLWTLRLGEKDGARYLRVAAGLAILQMAIHGLVDVPYMKNDLAFLTWFLLVLPSAAAARLDSSGTA